MGPDLARQAVHERALRAALVRFPPRHVRFPPRCMPVRGETVAETERAQLAPWGAWRGMPVRNKMMVPASEAEWARLAPWAAWCCMPVRDDRQVSLLATRQHHAEGPWAHVLATRHPAESSALDPFDIAAQFPLYVYVQPWDRETAKGQLSLDLAFDVAARGAADA